MLLESMWDDPIVLTMGVTILAMKHHETTWWRTSHGHRGEVGEPTLVIFMG